MKTERIFGILFLIVATMLFAGCVDDTTTNSVADNAPIACADNGANIEPADPPSCDPNCTSVFTNALPCSERENGEERVAPDISPRKETTLDAWNEAKQQGTVDQLSSIPMLQSRWEILESRQLPGEGDGDCEVRAFGAHRMSITATVFNENQQGEIPHDCTLRVRAKKTFWLREDSNVLFLCGLGSFIWDYQDIDPSSEGRMIVVFVVDEESTTSKKLPVSCPLQRLKPTGRPPNGGIATGGNDANSEIVCLQGDPKANGGQGIEYDMSVLFEMRVDTDKNGKDELSGRVSMAPKLSYWSECQFNSA